MDEFRKPYEYEEDKPVAGFILCFCAMLIICELLIGLTDVYQGAGLLRSQPFWHNTYLVFGNLYLIFIAFTCFAFYRLRRHAIKIAKVFLIYRLVFLTVATFIIYHYRLLDKKAIGFRINQFPDVQTLTLNCLIIPLAYTIVYSVLWYLYFRWSKRVKLYEKNALSQT